MPRLIDRTGKQYGYLRVVDRAPDRPRAGGYGNRTMWRCRCKCGVEHVVDSSALASGNTTSCGCLARGVKDETGKRYGRLMVLGRGPGRPDGLQGAQWLCRCDCGKEFVTRGSHLRRGDTSSCGCLAVDKLRASVMLPYGMAARNSVIRRAKANAHERGYEYALTDQQLCEFIAQPCYYCGSQPGNISRHPEQNGEFVYGGLDRVDNTKGYTLDNVVPCCKHCNIAKRDRTYDEFLEWIEAVYLHAVMNRKGERH